MDHLLRMDVRALYNNVSLLWSERNSVGCVSDPQTPVGDGQFGIELRAALKWMPSALIWRHSALNPMQSRS